MRQGGGTELRAGDVREGSSGGNVEVVCRECPPLVEDVARNDMLQARPGVTFALCDSSISLTSPQGKWGSRRNCIELH